MTNERTLLEQANFLLGGWLAWAECKHLTDDQFARMVDESQKLRDSLVTALAVEPKAKPDCPMCQGKGTVNVRTYDTRDWSLTSTYDRPCECTVVNREQSLKVSSD